MTALALCVLAFALTFWAGKRSLGKGVVVLLVFGCLYGILRANLQTTFSHFIFDSSLIGLYLAQFAFSPSQKTAEGYTALNYWVILLILWPMIVIFMPFQPLLVSLVGFRGIALFIPMLILGTRLRERDLVEICYGIIAMVLVAAVFAGAEYVLGLPRFYPRSPVTMIIYASGDVEGGFFRIPATFVNAHAYGGTMVFCLPFLLGFWNRAKGRYIRWLTVLSIAAALLGVLLSAARLSFLLAAGTVAAALFTGKISAGRRIAFIVLLAALAGVVLGQQRLQRFKDLGDSGFVADRVVGSVNRSFFEILVEHPMGNGLGGGGSSMPYFLEGEVRNPIGMENEYAMILAEQGIIGLLFWLGFIIWFLTRAGFAFSKGSWETARRTGWVLVTLEFGTTWIGIGLLSSIPGTALLLLIMGWASMPRSAETAPAGVRTAAPHLRYRQVPVASRL